MNSYDLSSLARLDLRKIWIFTAEKWGRRKADDYLQQIRSMIETLDHDHSIAVQFDPLDPNLRRRLVGSHAIFYRVVGGKTWVIRILHQTMDVGSHLN